MSVCKPAHQLLFLLRSVLFFLPVLFFWGPVSLFLEGSLLLPVLLLFLFLFSLLFRVYGGFSFGSRDSSVTVASLSLALFLADTAVLLPLFFLLPDAFLPPFRLWLWGTVFLLQLSALLLLVPFGNRLFARCHPKKRCLLVYGGTDFPHDLSHKLARRFILTAALPAGDSSLWEGIAGAEAVFLFAVPPASRTAILTFAYGKGIPVWLAAELEDILLSGARPGMLEDLPLFCIGPGGPSPVQEGVKRVFDLVLSGLGLLLFAPLMLLIAGLIRLWDGGPALFRQERATKDGRVFQVLKFRTMVEGADCRPAGDGDDRVTPVGRVLRRLRLDELPQLFNILKGEMSLVGPRPEHLSHVARYTGDLPIFRHRLRVKAGLTGLAQLAGRYNTPPKPKLMLDLSYIQRYSLLADLRLLLQTAAVFFKSDSTQGFPAEPAKNPPLTENDSSGTLPVE